eukprot:ANDGO_01081.mRNA.1 Monothiol glutaredoxin-3
MPVKEIRSTTQFLDDVYSPGPEVDLVHFSASWAPPCIQLHAVCEQLSKEYPSLGFWRVDADAKDCAQASRMMKIEAVPTVVFIKRGVEVDRFTGADVPSFVKKVKAFVNALDDENKQLFQKIKELLNQHHAILFMKGAPEAPKCGFSREIVQLIRSQGVDFHTVDILQDEELRQGLKAYAKWPTFPMFFVNGQLVGGVDVVRELIESDEFDGVMEDGQ